MKYLNLWVLFCVVVFCSCNSESTPTDVNEKHTQTTLIDTTWDVVSIETEDSSNKHPGTVGIFIEFNEDSTFSGRSYPKGDGPKASNSFNGQFSINGNQIRIDIIGSTKVGEPEGSRYFEFLSKLNEEFKYEISEDTLLIEINEYNYLELIPLNK